MPRILFPESPLGRQNSLIYLHSVELPGETWKSVLVPDLCSPSKIISNQCHSPREIYFITPFLSNDPRRCWS
jgi:hypothetical protein